jgi:hypothetical protein
MAPSVNRVYISSPFALWRGVLFPVPFIAMLVYTTNKAFTDANPTVMGGVSFGVFAMAVIYISWSVIRLKRVALLDDQLMVSSLTTHVEIPLEQVESLEWTQKAEDFNTPEARILLREPNALGMEIHFEPRSSAAFDLLRSKIEAANGRGLNANAT